MGFPTTALLTLLMAAAGASPQDRPASPLPCCFRHPSMASMCVESAKEERCGDILLYLNHPQSTGRTYCQSTSLRGGWTQEVDDDCCRSRPPG